MARYNKINRKVWTEGGMATLPPVALSESTLYLYLLTGDRPSRIAGLLRGAGTIADDTGWPVAGVSKALSALADRGLVLLSDRPAFVYVPEALAADFPSGNDRTGAINELEEFPECEPVNAAREALTEGVPLPLPLPLTEGVTGPLEGGVPQARSRNRKQEQEQEQEQEQALTPAESPPSVDPLDGLDGALTELGSFILDTWGNRNTGAASTFAKWLTVSSSSNPGVDLLIEARKAAAWELANPAKKKQQIRRFLGGWWSRQQDRAPSAPTERPSSTAHLGRRLTGDEAMRFLLAE